MALIYPPTANGLQKTLGAQLDTGVTASATLNNTTNIQNKAGLFVVDRIDTGGAEKDAAVREYISFAGVSGSTVTTLVRGLGGTTDQDHAVGAVVEFVSDVVQQQAILDALLSVVTTAGAVDTTKVVDLTTAQNLTNKSIQAPQGFLINGKIVPSVSSNNLTVAIKGLDGSNPSATNPVYCRIGDTVRSITAALSVTKNAGTNWCNAGGAELATQEIDYFVYLGYNATDGVVVGFSRIPYANAYSDFSATTTNEKYAAISTISNAAAGDYYENIGRFAATLSATANFYWSVPTFSALNLVQRPIFETRKLSVNNPLNFTIGAGAFASSYVIRGQMMTVLEKLTMAANSSFGNIAFYTPFAAADARSGMGNWSVFDNGTANYTYPIGISENSATTSQKYYILNSNDAGSATALGATAPITWANGDICVLNYYGFI